MFQNHKPIDLYYKIGDKYYNYIRIKPTKIKRYSNSI